MGRLLFSRKGYSLNLVEGVFSEVRIQDLGYNRVKTPLTLVCGGDPSSWPCHHILGCA